MPSLDCPISPEIDELHFVGRRNAENSENCVSGSPDGQKTAKTAFPPGRKTRNGDLKEEWCKAVYWNDQTNTYMLDLLFQKIRGIPKSGLDETWDASYSTGTIGVKATNPNFPAFNVAAAYNPGTYTGSPALKWFLPSYTDWLYTFAVLGFGDQEAAINRQRNYNWYGHLADLAFTQAGGTGISDKSYWVSSEITPYEGGLIFVNPTDLFWHSAKKNGNVFVHPFVKY